MSKGDRKSNREVRKPKKTAAEQSAKPPTAYQSEGKKTSKVEIVTKRK